MVDLPLTEPRGLDAVTLSVARNSAEKNGDKRNTGATSDGCDNTRMTKSRPSQRRRYTQEIISVPPRPLPFAC